MSKEERATLAEDFDNYKHMIAEGDALKYKDKNITHNEEKMKHQCTAFDSEKDMIACLEALDKCVHICAIQYHASESDANSVKKDVILNERI